MKRFWNEDDLKTIFDLEMQKFESLKILHNTTGSEKESEKETDQRQDELGMMREDAKELLKKSEKSTISTNSINNVSKRKVSRNRGSARKRINRNRRFKRKHRNEK